ncbi:MAG: hypothetical protein AMR96_00835 [Candidatus Adiutrix intracellularis]|jgi:hypothetical protein|nr:MAG: hypothetical protein AMR96_00835 [Candidatus Adiutrix intracellularis]
MDSRLKRLISKGEYKLNLDSKSWTLVKKLAWMTNSDTSTNVENNDIDNFHYYLSQTFSYKEFLFMVKYSFLILKGVNSSRSLLSTRLRFIILMNLEKIDIFKRDNIYVKVEI